MFHIDYSKIHLLSSEFHNHHQIIVISPLIHAVFQPSIFFITVE